MESEQRVSKQEALDLILAHWDPERTVETVPLAEAAGRALARDLTALGMGGWGQVPVVRRPKVAFLPTGSELVPAGAELRRGQNFDTNSVMAAQLLREMGAEPVLGPILRDDPETLKTALDALLDQADIVLLNAGTSKGGEDCCG